MNSRQHLIIFTDLDGTLLDGLTYGYEAAAEALDAVRSRHIPVILVSSKTRAEIEPLRDRLQLIHPFVVENGGGIVIPKTYFPFPIDGAVLRGDCLVLELGVPYARLRRILAELQQRYGPEMRGFGDMTPDEVARHTGLSLSDARLAKEREYDEPFLFFGSSSVLAQITEEIRAKGLRCVSGGRFFHLMGTQDKGHAVCLLSDLYRRQYADETETVLVTVGLGDSPNDLPMLAVVNRPFLVQRPDGSHDERVSLPELSFVQASGPSGWNRAVLSLVENIDGGTTN